MPPLSQRRPNLMRLLLIPILLLTLGADPALATQPATATEQLEAVLPEFQEELGIVLDDISAQHTIDAEVRLASGDMQGPHILGTLETEYTNTTGSSVDQLPFRLYSNREETPDVLTVSDVTRDGTQVEPEISGDYSTVSIPLTPPLSAGETTTVTMSFDLTVPVNEREHYGILNINPERGSWALAHWYPILAGWTEERGWILDPPSEYGDPIFSTMAAYELTLRTPDAWRVVSTGVAIDEQTTGSTTERRIVTGPVRDLTMVFDDDFESVEHEVDGTLITSWYDPGEETAGEAALDYAVQALAYFNEIIGPYPYTTLELAPVDLFGAAGVEFPQLIYMGSSYYTTERDLSPPNSFDFTVAHEVAHQWWYGIVGNNQYDHAFIDEGLTNFMSSEMYFEAQYGPEAGLAMVERYLEGPFRSHVTTGNDQVVNTPTDDFPSSSAYVFAAYSKAPMGFKAIYDEIGHDAFVEAMQMYYENHRFTIATPDDLLAAFNAAAEEDVTELWNNWFEETAGEDDV